MDKIKMAHEVLDLVFKANGGFIERSGKQEPTGEPTAFFAFSGHCPSVDVSIFPNGWHHEADYVKDREVFSFSDWHEDKELEEELNRLREYVEELTKGGTDMNRETFAKAVLDLALEINGGAIRRNGKGHPTAFCNYWGHINQIDVDVHPTGWVAEDEPDRFYFNLDKDSDNKLLDEYHRMSMYAVKLWREVQHD